MNSEGGAERQLLETLASLNATQPGVAAKPFDMWHDRIGDFDILHIFNPSTFPLEAIRIARIAAKESVLIAVSPIFYDSKGLVKEERGAIGVLLWTLAVRLRPYTSRLGALTVMDPYRFLEPLLSISDAILPNTSDELIRLRQVFPSISPTKFAVVPNGVNEQFAGADPDEFCDQYNCRDFILFVGRVEQRKNVLRLIRAFVSSRLQTKLVVVGEAADENYMNRCKNEANDQVMFLPPLEHNSSMLASAYKACKVIALPSYYETPGLAALEGGLAGANVVVTAVGGAREYFGDLAWYVEPENEHSIRNALVAAHNAPNSTALSNHIRKHFDWAIVAKKSADVYASMLTS